MNKKLKLLCLLSTLCIAASATACSMLSDPSSSSSESSSSSTSESSPVESSPEEETDVAPSAITLNASANTIAKGGAVTFSIAYTPENATLTDFDLAILSGADFAEVNNETKTLTIKSDAALEAINGKTITVVATLKANPSVMAVKVITVSEEASVTFLSCETINFVANKDSQKSIVTEAYNWDGSPMDVEASDLTYTVQNSNVATVDEYGVITPKGHGSTVVKVAYGNVETECVVNVMVAPEAINFVNLNEHVAKVGVLNYAKETDKYLNLGVEGLVKEGYGASTTKVQYKFESLEVGAPATVATYDEDNGGIMFHTTGKVKVTVVSDSSLNDVEVSEKYEVSKSIIVDVNNGMNIYTVADFKAYADDANAGKIANFMADVRLTNDNNFGNANSVYEVLTLRGSRTIQGNGYTMSTEALTCVAQPEGQKNPTFLHFLPLGTTVADSFSVGIYDLTMRGNIDTMGNAPAGSTGPRTYNRALEIAGPTLWEYDTGARGLLENVVVENVTVTGFMTGLRVEHAIAARIDTFYVANCYANGIENCQSNMTLKDITIGQVGAFGVEITPDDMRNKETANPSGSAGMQYNATPTVKFEGYLNSNNWNNGQSTPYMQGLLGGGIGQLVNAITIGLIQNLTSDATMQAQLAALMGEVAMDEDKLNFASLIFIDPGAFLNYILANQLEGNSNARFCEFRTDEMIGVKDLLEGAMNDPTGYDYTAKKYLILDIVVDAGLINKAYAGVTINIGQIVLVNKAYKGA